MHSITFEKDIKRFFKGLRFYVRKFLTTESPFKMIKNFIYFMLKVFFIIEIFTFLS